MAKDEIELLSDKNVDYSKLRDFLANGQWQKADMETASCMLKVAGREEQGYLEEEDIENFPCTDLRTIDQLWVKYSNGKFGFSVQKKIYQSLGGTKEYSKLIWERFVDQVGWREGDKLSYSEGSMSIKGYLPGAVGRYGIVGRVRRNFFSWDLAFGLYLPVFSRIEACRL